MSTWSNHDNRCLVSPQVPCGGIGSTFRTGHRHGSSKVYPMRQDVFDFGKHKGKHINQVDNGYLEVAALTRRGKMKREQSATRDVHVHDLLSDLKSCTRKKDLQKGKRIHAKAVETGNESNVYVAATLINMYAKCGSMVDARSVFDSIQEPDVVSWNALILGYGDSGQGLVALELFSRMKDKCRYVPDSVTYIAALKACASLAANGDETEKKGCLERGREIHLGLRCHMDHFLQSTLINMYAKCRSMIDARSVFDGVQQPDVVSWNAMILGYADNVQGLVALDLFSRMKECRCAPNSVTYVAALKACTSLVADGDEARKKVCLDRGREIHCEIGCHMDRFLQGTLIDMYAKCGSMDEARIVFDSIHEPDVVSWTALILGYANGGQGLVALDLFSKMKDECRSPPDSTTYLAALKACTSLGADGDGKKWFLERGREIHSEIGCHMDPFVQMTLVSMYVKCASMEEARAVFDSIQEPVVVSWNALILGYADNGQGLVALELFSRMKDECRCPADSTTYLAALKACTSLAENEDENGKKGCLERGRAVHLEIGWHMDRFVQNTLINMYAKCGSMVDARRVFDTIQEPEVVSWNALILGYADNGQGLVALDLFSRMKDECEAPNSVTYVAALKACGSNGALAIGRRFHSEISEFDAHVVTSLVDFYAKCGSMIEAREVFNLHPRARGVSTWNALLAGYGRFGNTGSVFSLFEAMQDQDFRPDAVTFLCILGCCSHAGLVEKAWAYLEVMPTWYGLTPSVMHYTCMVDILGRANKLYEAVALLQKMPCEPNAVTWMTLLGACRKWENVEIGRMAFKSLVDLDKKNASAYILMAEIYGSKGMWEEQVRVLQTRMKSGTWKLHGQAYVMDGKK